MVSEQFNPVILDLGSSTVRAGWAGHDQPKFAESSYLGRKPDGVLDPIPVRFLKRTSSEPVDIVRAQEFRPESLEWTLDSDCLASLSETLVYSSRGLQANALERPLFATCPTDASPEFKRSYYEHFMETVQVPAFFLGDTSILSMYASGRTSGICVDVGASSTTIARIARGEAISSSTYAVGGDSIDQFIASRVDVDVTVKNSKSFIENHKLALIREIKHSACRCSHHPLQPASPSAPASRVTRGSRKISVTSPSGRGSLEPVVFKMPDGAEVDISAVQEYAAESLFHPSNGFPGLAAAVIEKFEDPFVLLTGGSAHFHGLHTRLVHELDAKLEQNASTVFPFAQWTHRQHSSFIGASILASLSSFSAMWVTPASFAENGLDRIVKSK